MNLMRMRQIMKIVKFLATDLSWSIIIEKRLRNNEKKTSRKRREKKSTNSVFHFITIKSNVFFCLIKEYNSEAATGGIL